MASMIGLESGGVRHAKFGPPPVSGRFGGDPGPLGHLVQFEVIPRLLVAHSEPPVYAGSHGARITPEDADRLAFLALSLEAHAVLDAVEYFLRGGVSVETVFVELLAPAARRLGRGWDEDSIDFIDVTMGLWRLQEVLREIASRTPRIVQAAESPRQALFAPMPGELHAFGAAMVSECFARAGWDAELMVDADRAGLLRRLADNAFDVVGLTVGCDCHIEPLRPLVTAMRTVSRNPDICIMIGGHAPTRDPALVAAVGADATAPTAIEAVAVAERLVAAAGCAVAV